MNSLYKKAACLSWILVSPVLAACEPPTREPRNEPVSPQCPSFSKSPNPYLPLRVGNQWKYTKTVLRPDVAWENCYDATAYTMELVSYSVK